MLKHFINRLSIFWVDVKWSHNYAVVSPTSHRADFGSKFRKRPPLNRRAGRIICNVSSYLIRIHRLFLLDYDGC